MAIEPKKVSALDSTTIQAMRELGLGYITVSVLPETISDGVILLYNGTLWRGLLTGESSLPAGTPWPAKGYKEFIFKIRAEYGEVSFYNVIIDEWGVSSNPDTPIISSVISIPYPLAIYGYSNIDFGIFVAIDDSNVFQGITVEYLSATDIIRVSLPFDISGAEMGNLIPSLRFYPPPFVG